MFDVNVKFDKKLLKPTWRKLAGFLAIAVFTLMVARAAFDQPSLYANPFIIISGVIMLLPSLAYGVIMKAAGFTLTGLTNAYVLLVLAVLWWYLLAVSVIGYYDAVRARKRKTPSMASKSSSVSSRTPSKASKKKSSTKKTSSKKSSSKKKPSSKKKKK